MPVFPDALIGDTTDLSIEEFGAYVMILMVTWRNNGRPLADDPVRMARICRLSEKRWAEKVRPVISRFFDLSEGTWRQARLEKEWNYVANQRAIQSEKGKKGGRPKSLENNDSDKAAALSQLKPEQSPQSQPHKELTSEAGASEATVKTAPLGHDPKPANPQSQDLNALFSEWWEFVPRKVSKGQAEKAYRAALRHATPDELLAGIRRYAEQVADEEPRFKKHAATWLNGKCWLDEPLPAAANPSSHGAASHVRQAQQHRPASRPARPSTSDILARVLDAVDPQLQRH